MDIKLLDTYFDRLYPICRSILGKGYRESLAIMREVIPFDILEFHSGQQVFDWVIPDEWEVNEAYLEDINGEKIIDFKNNNLHLINYSDRYIGEVAWEELREHLYFDRDLPKAIPYVTSYYKKKWGFCLSYEQFEKLPRTNYKVVIDTHFKKGVLQVGEYLLKGRSNKEILISTYLCHPSMGNNELSGPLVMMYLYHQIKQIKNRIFSYRFVVNPETIGSISYSSLRKGALQTNVLAGVVLTCLGGFSDKLSYKKSKNGNSIIDRLFVKSMNNNGRIREFTPLGGSDERQYNTIGINIPIGQIARTVYDEYPEYHTSLDNKDFMNLGQVHKSAEEIFKIFNLLESTSYFENLSPFGEPQLGKRGLYPNMNTKQTRRNSSSDSLTDGRNFNKIVMYLLNYSDGTFSTRDIAEMIDVEEQEILEVANKLESHKLLRKI
jgi:hypothetical protein